MQRIDPPGFSIVRAQLSVIKSDNLLIKNCFCQLTEAFDVAWVLLHRLFGKRLVQGRPRELNLASHPTDQLVEGAAKNLCKRRSADGFEGIPDQKQPGELFSRRLKIREVGDVLIVKVTVLRVVIDDGGPSSSRMKAMSCWMVFRWTQSFSARLEQMGYEPLRTAARISQIRKSGRRVRHIQSFASSIDRAASCWIWGIADRFEGDFRVFTGN